MLSEVVETCSKLIQFDTSNYGGGNSRGEQDAAEWVHAQLTEVGYEPRNFESAPGRVSTILRLKGTDPSLPALLVHGHLDVVPVEPSDWSFDPFSGDIRDGSVWGRGALDMKDMDAMMLVVARDFARGNFTPPRDIVFAFVADEEDTGEYGAWFLVKEHPELFEGVKTAIGESGGFPVYLPNNERIYPIATGERGSAWMNLTARGTAGHGSRKNVDNAVANLADVVSKLSRYEWPVRITPTVERLLTVLSDHLQITVDPSDPKSLEKLGSAARLVESVLTNSVNLTGLTAGYKVNVIPSEALATIDGRLLPGTEDEFFAVIDGILGEKVTREFASFARPVDSSFESSEFAAMEAALIKYDPEAIVLPYTMSGGTDAKAFSSLGISCYGFAPGYNAPEFDPWTYVHGVDEHIPTESLEFGVQVLRTYLSSSPNDFLQT